MRVPNFCSRKRATILGAGFLFVAWWNWTPLQAQSFSLPQNISANSGTSSRPTIALGGGGQIYIAWTDNSLGSFDVFFAKSTDLGTTFTSPMNISNTGGAQATCCIFPLGIATFTITVTLVSTAFAGAPALIWSLWRDWDVALPIQVLGTGFFLVIGVLLVLVSPHILNLIAYGQSRFAHRMLSDRDYVDGRTH